MITLEKRNKSLNCYISLKATVLTVKDNSHNIQQVQYNLKKKSNWPKKVRKKQ
jgi:hypothetical protein